LVELLDFLVEFLLELLFSLDVIQYARDGPFPVPGDDLRDPVSNQLVVFRLLYSNVQGSLTQGSY
jgi:hypothetical protein